MELKEYQKKCLSIIRNHLTWLEKYKVKHNKIKEEHGIAINFPLDAWNQVITKEYISKRNGIGEHLPNFCIKVPTGGGKTLLACHAIDAINTNYLKKKTGFVLWIVPTNQIYRQTLEKLKDKNHPYRQVLDISSGNHTIIAEKLEKISPLDVEENLVVMLLMLPSANRRNSETLKIFQDAGYDAFFPPEDAWKEHEELIEAIPNLDYYGDEKNILFYKQVKTSLGNVFKILKPIVIIDEGQRAYSEGAQATIRNFNPSIVVELSATPHRNSNTLVDIKGRELDKEKMIKLDINIINKRSPNWKDTLLTSIDKRMQLENEAVEYKYRTGVYIRPINLIQVERTGANQRGLGYIHSEDVKEFLIRECNISADEIAIKSSETDDIEGIDLLHEDCPIRYIITKQALQEGWDCSFAYILTILTNPTSEMSITQLVGRILRQPYAKKTKVLALDESYIYCFRPNANDILNSIKDGLEGEGLGDLSGRLNTDIEGDAGNSTITRVLEYRGKFKKFAGKIYLPRFFVNDDEKWRELCFESDLLIRIDWSNISLDLFERLILTDVSGDDHIRANLSDNDKNLINSHATTLASQNGLTLDYILIARRVSEYIPNPWVAYTLAKNTVDILKKRYKEDKITKNIIFVIEELCQLISNERDRLCEQIFRNMVKKKELVFFLEATEGFALRKRLLVNDDMRKLTKANGNQLEKDLFDFVPEQELNNTEKSVAYYLDEQEKLLWWYRNISRKDYYVQGWKKYRIYPDFIFSEVYDDNPDDFSKVFIVETKGLHLDNPDTAYKKDVFDLCNELGKEIKWDELKEEFKERKIVFQVINEIEWQRKINEMFATDVS
jgi:type III restriction enzyme